ncbi:MAG: hypothetical protein R2755_26780 [Acidimicrobiales bacterium]
MIASPASAPAWNVAADVPKIVIPANVVVLPTVSSCFSSSTTSACSAVPSLEAVLAAATASSLMRWRMACTSSSAPSPTCTKLTASCTLRSA